MIKIPQLLQKLIRRDNKILPPFPKVRFSRVCTLIKNLINVYNLIYFLLYYTLFNNFSPMKFSQFKYSQLMFLKTIIKYLNNIENLSLWSKKKSKTSYFREQRE